MADTKITALAAITTVDPAVDVLPIVDVSDTSMAASGTTKKITSNQILGSGGTATLASATITGDLTVDTNVLKVDTLNNRVGVLNTPTVPLEVTGLIAASSGVYQAGGSNGIFAGLNNDGTNPGLDLRRWTGTSSNHGAAYIATSVLGDALFYTDTVASNTKATSLRMTLNSTGLGIGITPELKLRVDGPDAAPATSGSSTTNGAFRIGAVGSSTNLCVDSGVSTTGGAYGWFQARSRSNYALNYDIVLNPNGGNVGIGVTPVTGAKLSVAGPIVRNKGATSCTQNVATTVATLPGEGLYIAYAYFNASNTNAFTSYAVILCDSVGSRIIANNGTQITITTSTFALQITQAFFTSPTAIAWSFVQIG